MTGRPERTELVRLLEGDLDADRRSAIAAQLLADPALQREVDALRTSGALVDGVLPEAFPAIEATPALRAAIGRRVIRSHRRGRLVRLSVGWAAAAALFFAVLLGVPGYEVGDHSPRIATLVDADDDDFGRLEASMYDFEDF